jgi:hypothetical protein
MIAVLQSNSLTLQIQSWEPHYWLSDDQSTLFIRHAWFPRILQCLKGPSQGHCLSEWLGNASLSDDHDRGWDYIHSRELADCNQGTWSNWVSQNGWHMMVLLVTFRQIERVLEISWEGQNWPQHHLPVHKCQDQPRHGPLRSNFHHRPLSGLLQL